MSDHYLAALWQEISAWKQVEKALLEQRQALLHRRSQELWEVQDRLSERLRQAVICRNQTLRCKPRSSRSEVAAIEEQAERMHRQVHDAVRLNHELLKDVCTYFEMIREVVFPQTLPPTYDHPARRPRSASASAIGSRVA